MVVRGDFDRGSSRRHDHDRLRSRHHRRSSGLADGHRSHASQRSTSSSADHRIQQHLRSFAPSVTSTGLTRDDLRTSTPYSSHSRHGTGHGGARHRASRHHKPHSQRFQHQRQFARSASVSPASAPRVTWSNPVTAAPMAAAPASRAFDTHRPAASTSTVPSRPSIGGLRPAAPTDGCLHCRQAHWLSDCPTATEHDRAVARASARARAHTVAAQRGQRASAGRRHHAARIVTSISEAVTDDSHDGICRFGADPHLIADSTDLDGSRVIQASSAAQDGALPLFTDIDFVADTGASREFISLKRAFQISTLPGFHLAPIVHFGVATAGTAVLTATHYVEGPVTLLFPHPSGTGFRASATMHIRFYAVDGFDNNSVLIGRGGLRRHFNIDFSNLLLTAQQHMAPPPNGVHAYHPLSVPSASARSATASATQRASSPVSATSTSPPSDSDTALGGDSVIDSSLPLFAAGGPTHANGSDIMFAATPTSTVSAVPTSASHPALQPPAIHAARTALSTSTASPAPDPTPAADLNDDPTAAAAFDVLQPEIVELDMETIRVKLQLMLDDLVAAYPFNFVRDWCKLVMHRHLNCFRDKMVLEPQPVSIPGAPDGVEVHVDDAAFARLRTQFRSYSRPAADAIQVCIDQLCAAGVLVPDVATTFASPVHAVRKPGVPLDAPVTAQWRVTVDLRDINRITSTNSAPLPRLDEVRQYVQNAQYFGSLDLLNGFFQFPLHVSSQRYFFVQTPRGSYRALRLLQGGRTSAGTFHNGISRILGDCVYKYGFLYIDDVAIWGSTLSELLERWLVVLGRLDAANVKINVAKIKFVLTSLPFLGFVLSPSGVSPNPAFVSTVLGTPRPQTVHQLRQFLATVNFCRDHIPRFAARSHSLQQLLTAALRDLSRGRNHKQVSRAAQHALVTDFGWTAAHDAAFEDLRTALVSATALAYPFVDPDWETCVYTDASDFAWAGVITQRRVADRHLPIRQQRHRPLAFCSGLFSGAQLVYPPVEKEGLGVVLTLLKNQHILDILQQFTLYTDHANLIQIFQSNSSRAVMTRAVADRLQRWNCIVAAFKVVFCAIPGDDNFIADLYSRLLPSESPSAASLLPPPEQLPTGSVPFGGSSVPVAAARAVTRSQRRVEQSDAVAGATSVIGSSLNASTASGGSTVTVTVEPVVAAPIVAPTATADLAPSSISIHSVLIANSADAPLMSDIVSAQASITQHDIAAFGLVRDDSGVLRDLQFNRVFIPDVGDLRIRLCAVAHKALAGHRGVDTTLSFLSELCFWPDMRSFVRTYCASCVHCLRAKGGKIVQRPWLRSPANASDASQVTAPGQCISFDFCHIRRSETAAAVAADGSASPVMRYCLVIVDVFSRHCQLIATSSCDASSTVTALLQYFSVFGIVLRWLSDRGSHFCNQVMTEFALRCGAVQAFTAAYAPFSNGCVERVNRCLRQALVTLLMDDSAVDDSWPTYLPIICHCINNSPSSVLGNFTPFQVHLGRRSINPLIAVFAPIPIQIRCVDTARVREAVDELQFALDVIHEAVNDMQPRAHPPRAGVTPIDFGVGDLVLLARHVVDPASRTVRDKTRADWVGPMRCVQQLNERLFLVEDLVTGRRFEVHAAYIRRCASADTGLTSQLLATAAYGSTGYVAVKILDHQFDVVDGTLYFRVLWELGDITWELARRFRIDAPVLFNSYLRGVSHTERSKVLDSSK